MSEVKKRIIIIWEEMLYAETWKDFFDYSGFEVELVQYFDGFDFSERVDLIIYHVDVVRWVDGVHKSGRRIGFNLFKGKEDKISCPIIFCSVTMFDLESLKEKDNKFKKYVEDKGNLCINPFHLNFRGMIELVKKKLEEFF